VKENNTRKKIAIISPSLKMGRIERELTVLANHFVDLGHEVILYPVRRIIRFIKWTIV
jgi:hypothetical protein